MTTPRCAGDQVLPPRPLSYSLPDSRPLDPGKDPIYAKAQVGGAFNERWFCRQVREPHVVEQVLIVLGGQGVGAGTGVAPFPGKKPRGIAGHVRMSYLTNERNGAAIAPS